MNSYADVDGIPAGASRGGSPDLLRGHARLRRLRLLRLHAPSTSFVDRQRVAADAAEAGRLAIAGRPRRRAARSRTAYGDVLAAEVERGAVDRGTSTRLCPAGAAGEVRGRAVRAPVPDRAHRRARGRGRGRELSRELARRSIVLARNDGILPLTPGEARRRRDRPARRRAVAAVPDLHLPVVARSRRVHVLRRARHHERCRRDGRGLVQQPCSRRGSTEPGPRALRRAVARRRDRRVRPTVQAAPGCTLTRDLGTTSSTARWPRPGRRRRACSRWAAPACGSPASGPRARPATPPTSRCRPPRCGWPRRSSQPARRWWSSSSRAAAYALPQVVQDAAAIVVAPYAGAVRHAGDRRRALRRGQPLRQAAVQRAAARRPDPGLPPPESRLRLPQAVAARRLPALSRHAGDTAVAVRPWAQLHHVRPVATSTAAPTSTRTARPSVSATVDQHRRPGRGDGGPALPAGQHPGG